MSLQFKLSNFANISTIDDLTTCNYLRPWCEDAISPFTYYIGSLAENLVVIIVEIFFIGFIVFLFSEATRRRRLRKHQRFAAGLLLDYSQHLEPRLTDIKETYFSYYESIDKKMDAFLSENGITDADQWSTELQSRFFQSLNLIAREFQGDIARHSESINHIVKVIDDTIESNAAALDYKLAFIFNEYRRGLRFAETDWRHMAIILATNVDITTQEILDQRLLMSSDEKAEQRPETLKESIFIWDLDARKKRVSDGIGKQIENYTKYKVILTKLCRENKMYIREVKVTKKGVFIIHHNGKKSKIHVPDID